MSPTARRPTRCSPNAVDDGLILLSAGFAHQVVRWMPPIDVTADEIDKALDIFWGAVQAVPTAWRVGGPTGTDERADAG